MMIKRQLGLRVSNVLIKEMDLELVQKGNRKKHFLGVPIILNNSITFLSTYFVYESNIISGSCLHNQHLSFKKIQTEFSGYRSYFTRTFLKQL